MIWQCVPPNRLSGIAVAATKVVATDRAAVSEVVELRSAVSENPRSGLKNPPSDANHSDGGKEVATTVPLFRQLFDSPGVIGTTGRVERCAEQAAAT